MNPIDLQTVLAGLANPGTIFTGLAVNSGIKTGYAAGSTAGQAVTTAAQNAVDGFSQIGKNIAAGASGFAVNFGFAALVVILFVALFMRAVS